MYKVNSDAYERLLPLIAAGDQHAFSELYEIFYPTLLRHVIQKVNSLSAAEDILHDLFLSIWKTRERITEIDSLPAYLFTSCRYLIISSIKKKQLEFVHEENYDEHPDTERSIEEKLYYRYLLDIVNEEIERLPEKCKEVFKLSRIECKTNKEIALHLHISESTVENQINKALKRLKFITKDILIIIAFINMIK
ncbi:RNA polymerase sigma-70 factor [Mucilaginibacter sp. MD40]|uniref:RNA polymerase sigma factor n=1 Tax=Mucilaginibacter sp. MD40 TaxID=2029590 RepID=UPI000BACAA31|nr:RNA polymerase sigma-70 factor [Mucilaginibacter sp. MD40]PAW92334.1 RNA polymerase sigma-70 factor [Mucilaginibacter sp. MD40]